MTPLIWSSRRHDPLKNLHFAPGSSTTPCFPVEKFAKSNRVKKIFPPKSSHNDTYDDTYYDNYNTMLLLRHYSLQEIHPTKKRKKKKKKKRKKENGGF